MIPFENTTINVIGSLIGFGHGERASGPTEKLIRRRIAPTLLLSAPFLPGTCGEARVRFVDRPNGYTPITTTTLSRCRCDGFVRDTTLRFLGIR
jgi:hypothetical protein